MDSKHSQELWDKYMRGETSIEEEELLRRYYLSDQENLETSRVQYFKNLDAFHQLQLVDSWDEDFLNQKCSPPSPVGRVIPWRYILSVAAAVALFVVCFSILQLPRKSSNVNISQYEKDPKAAFELTKQSLQLISVKLNKGAVYTYEVGRFNQTLDKLKFQPKKDN